MSAMLFTAVNAMENDIEILDLDVIAYEDFASENPEAMAVLQKALLEKGIVGIKGIPGYKEKVFKYIETARAFSALPEEVKITYSPNRANGDVLGYERAKEKFKRPDGKWFIDDLKISYYSLVPDSPYNKWPVEMDLSGPFEDLGKLMADMGRAVMTKIGLVGSETGLVVDDTAFGRMLHYRKSVDGTPDNPYWCGAHFDHGMFTALLPAFYFANGEAIAEPIEAGLFVKNDPNGNFKKVIANDPDVLMFQVGEFGQLISNDGIRATEHRVHKAQGIIERFTLALFFAPPMDSIIFSSSELTKDSRYEGMAGDPCTFRTWHENSLKRYLVTEEDPK